MKHSKSELPSGWHWYHLGKLCEVRLGGTPRRREPAYWGGDNVWVKVGELEGGVIVDSEEHITDRGIENSNVKLIPPGTVLLSFKLSLGKLAIAGCGLYTNEAIAGLPIRNPRILDRDYLYYVLQSIDFESYAPTAVKGKLLNKGILQEIPIRVPPLPIQRRIVDILEQADKLRRKRAQADELAARIPSALFVKMFGDPTTNPMGWPIVELDEVANITMGQSPPSSTYNTEGVGLPFFQGKAEFGEIYPSTQRWCSKPKKVAEKGDILLSVRAPVGPVNLAPSKCCIGRGLAAIRGYEHKLAQKWLFHHIRIREQGIASTSSGTTFQAITSEEVRQLAIARPPIELQQQFAEMTNRLEDQLEQQAHSRQHLDGLFESLLASAFRGELTAGLTLQEAFGFTERQMALLRLLSGAAQIREPVLVTSAMKYAFLFQTEGARAGQPVERIAAEPRAPYATEPAYDFVPYKYGPFARELYDDLEALEAAGLVKSEHPPKSKGALRGKTEIYLVQNQTATIHGLGDNLLSEARQAADAVIGQYGNLSQKQLLDLVYQRYPEYAINNQRRGEG